MSDENHQCPRCGAPLKVETVQIPVYVGHTLIGGDKSYERVIARYEEEEQVSDCVRCMGAY